MSNQVTKRTFHFSCVSYVDRQSGGETFAFLFVFGALAAVAAVALTTDVFDDFPIIGDILGEFDHHLHACFYSFNFN